MSRWTTGAVLAAAAVLFAIWILEGRTPPGSGEGHEPLAEPAPEAAPALRGASQPESPAPHGAPEPHESRPAVEAAKPTVQRFQLASPAGWIDRPKIGCRLIVTSAPAWYSYDESHWQPGGTSLREEYPSTRYPSLDGAVCLLTLVGHITTGANAWNVEGVLVVDGAEVADVGVGGSVANIIGGTGGPPPARWNIPVDRELLGLLQGATTAEIRFRQRLLTREEDSDKRVVVLNGKRITMREYLARQRPPGAVSLGEDALQALRQLSR